VPIPRVRIAPDYPQRALSRGQSGDVTLRFTIAADGTTKDIEIVDATSPIFERPAVEALSKWRYAPPTENGNRVEKRGVQTVISFALAN
jgi:protein TonB